MTLLPVGFGNYVSAEMILTVLAPDSAPIRRLVSDSREKGLLIDASFGRSTRSVLVMNSGHVVLSARTPDDLAVLLANTVKQEDTKE